MPESRKRKPRKLSKGQSPPPPWWQRHWKATVAVVGTIAAFVGFASAVVTFLPRLTVESGGPTDPSSPYPIPFVITNTGIIPMSQVQPMVGLCDIYYGEPKNLPERCPKILTFLVFGPWFANKLAPDERYTIHLNEFLNITGAKFAAADLSIKIEYYPWFLTLWPFHRAKEFRFQTALGTDGKLSWKARPLDK
jgi:hypothetical protein